MKRVMSKFLKILGVFSGITLITLLFAFVIEPSLSSDSYETEKSKFENIENEIKLLEEQRKELSQLYFQLKLEKDNVWETHPNSEEYSEIYLQTLEAKFAWEHKKEEVIKKKNELYYYSMECKYFKSSVPSPPYHY